MNETEKAVAAKLLTQIMEAVEHQQLDAIQKYSNFMAAVNIRIHHPGAMQ